ncbi:prepilin-type N-terminal cleavage/methylation domain-containing protein [Lactobacillus sp. S2-2]|uniref:competence type IV pilus major pilin ComGC n=1 Tax=Lactobacillus sp. S2-2 TaxID=2692917 RepID=UPI001F245FC6|nr:competence type IV pilus major pilin ComGC [Lactobacillus sp. S2-2]MCF6515829.1 prepilin-type N-terminal cleavage/methylation domain-containing protein [Lactobacillus sp. S2-2]
MKRKGFTLIEMTIVLFIISLLILIIIPNVIGQKNNAKKIHVDAMKSVVQTQVDSYLGDDDSKDVTYEILEKDKYLSSKQINSARKEGIEIIDNQVKSK